MTMIICAVIILWLTVVAMIYKLREIDNLITRYNQRITDNFAQAYDNRLKINSINRYIDNKAESVLHDEDSLKALQDRVKQLSDRTNNQLGLINHNDDDINQRLTKFKSKIYSYNFEQKIKALENRFSPEYLLSYHNNDIHDILINVEEKLVDRIKTLEGNYIGLSGITEIFDDNIVSIQDKVKALYSDINDHANALNKKIENLEEKLEINNSNAYENGSGKLL